MSVTSTTSYFERVGLSPSGGGVAIWVGEEVRLQLDWDQARQLHRLLADQFAEREATR